MPTCESIITSLLAVSSDLREALRATDTATCDALLVHRQALLETLPGVLADLSACEREACLATLGDDDGALQNAFRVVRNEVASQLAQRQASPAAPDSRQPRRLDRRA